MMMFIMKPDHSFEEEPDLMKWAEWMGTADRHVADDRVAGVRISTVFLGLDGMAGLMGRAPLLFETAVFDDAEELPLEQARYHTWDEAVVGHEEMVERVKKRMVN